MSRKLAKPYHIIDEKRLQNCLEFIANEFIRRQNEQEYKPFTVDFKEHDPKRGLSQNDLQHVWYDIAARYSDMGWSKDDFRAHCKLYIGIPILYAENPSYKESVESLLGGRSDEIKLKAMLPPVEIEVTREMTKAQMTTYLSRVYDFLTIDCGIDIDGVLRYEQA